VSIVADVGTTTGEQHVTVSQGSKAGHLTVLLGRRRRILRGRLSRFAGLTGMSAKVAAEFAGKWISVPSSNASFSSLAGSLAVKSAATQLVQLSAH